MTDHFPLSELVASEKAKELQIDNTPPPSVLANIVVLKQNLERVRVILGNKPMEISSGFRCAALNHAVGGASNSDHMRGLAADFTCPGFGSPDEIVKAIAASPLEFDQCILEYRKGAIWVHISFAPAMRRNTITMRYDSSNVPQYSKGVS